MDSALEVRSGYVPVPGGNVWFAQYGDDNDTPVFVLHGGPGFPHNVYAPLTGLATTRPVILYDQLGCGRSDRPTDTALWTIGRFVEELDQLRRHLGIDKMHILGHSWGGTLALEYNARHPARVEKLILVSPLVSASRWMTDAADLLAELPEDVQATIARHEQTGVYDTPEYQEACSVFYDRHVCRIVPRPQIYQDSVAGFGLDVYHYMWGPSEFACTGTLQTFEFADRLAALSLPVLFLCGRHDEARPETLAQFQRAVPGAQLHVFENSAALLVSRRDGRLLAGGGHIPERVAAHSRALHDAACVMIRSESFNRQRSGVPKPHSLMDPLSASASPAKPFLKWAGGKTQLLSQIGDYYPPELRQGRVCKYVEPFLGGGAVFLDVVQRYEITSAYLSDINPELVLVYRVVQRDPHDLIDRLDRHARAYLPLDEADRKQYFYTTRAAYNEQRTRVDYTAYADDWIVRAAHMIFLNKTCYNGLFRVNARGEFNVPFGRYRQPRLYDEENLLRISKYLQIAELRHGAFTNCEDAVDAQSFVYFDPPYRPLSDTAHFTSYSTGRFDDREQIRLARFYAHLHDEYAAKLMLSNSDPKNTDAHDAFFDDLYARFHVRRVRANRMINANTARRGKITELLVTNY